MMITPLLLPNGVDRYEEFEASNGWTLNSYDGGWSKVAEMFTDGRTGL